MSATMFPAGYAHDPGGKVRMKLQPGVTGRAIFSPCGRYRSLLWRAWDVCPETQVDTPYLLSIGMNPSTAAADVDDPTIRRDIALARREGCSAMVKANVMDYRATDPAMLRAPGVVPVSPDNVPAIVKAAHDAARVVVTFGAIHPRLRGHALTMLRTLEDRGITLWCLGTTADGSPRHPLYVRGDTPLEIWKGWR